MKIQPVKKVRVLYAAWKLGAKLEFSCHQLKGQWRAYPTYEYITKNNYIDDALTYKVNRPKSKLVMDYQWRIAE